MFCDLSHFVSVHVLHCIPLVSVLFFYRREMQCLPKENLNQMQLFSLLHEVPTRDYLHHLRLIGR